VSRGARDAIQQAATRDGTGLEETRGQTQTHPVSCPNAAGRGKAKSGYVASFAQEVMKG